MGCTNSVPSDKYDGGGKQDALLEQQLLQERLKELFNFKILLLGAGESGKSTIVKQLRLIHKVKPSAAELETMATTLHHNVMECMQALLLAAERFGYEMEEDLVSAAKWAEKWTGADEQLLTPQQGETVQELFNSEALTKTYARRNEFWILDSFPYYMENLDRFCEEDFKPNEIDMVMTRYRTTGIVVSELEQKLEQPAPDEPDTLSMQVVDVGGQRNERKKWMHCFDDVKAVLFIVNLAGYDQVLFEDASKNRLMEALELFSSITGQATFKDTPVFLFLNKKDLFETMIRKKDLSHLFPEYTGGCNVQPAIKFLEDKFRSLMPNQKHVEIEVVSGVYKPDIKAAFHTVKGTLLELNRKKMDEEKKAIKRQAKSVQKKLAK